MGVGGRVTQEQYRAHATRQSVSDRNDGLKQIYCHVLAKIVTSGCCAVPNQGEIARRERAYIQYVSSRARFQRGVGAAQRPMAAIFSFGRRIRRWSSTTASSPIQIPLPQARPSSAGIYAKSRSSAAHPGSSIILHDGYRNG